MKKIILFVVMLFTTQILLAQVAKIGEVYGFTFMPDGNNVIGIAKRSDGVKIRVWDIYDPNTIIETNSFKLKDFEEIDLLTNKYKLSTNKDGTYLAVGIRPNKTRVTRIYIYKIKNGNHIATIKTDKLFEGCNRHHLGVLEFSSDNKYLYFSDMHNKYRYNIGTGSIKKILKEKSVILMGYDIYNDMFIVAGEKITPDGNTCPNKNDIHIVDGDRLHKISYENIVLTHNRFMPHIIANKHLNLTKVNNPYPRVYLKSNMSNKFLSIMSGSKIIEIFVTL